MAVRRLGLVVGIPLLGLLLGIAIAIASSPSSLSRDRSGAVSAVLRPSSPLPSPTPSIASAGKLGSSGRLFTNGSGNVIAVGSNFAYVSVDGGRTWSRMEVPSTGSGLVVDTINPNVAITGGQKIQVTNSAGKSWSTPQNAPPGKGPYQPLAISSLEPNVWFFTHQDRLLVTLDAGVSWKDLTGVPVPSLIAPGGVVGQFFLASGNRVFEIDNYGQSGSPTELPSLPLGAASDLVSFSGGGTRLLVRAGGQGVFRFDGTKWWSTQLSGPVASADGAILVGNGGAKLGVRGQISYSTDGGTSWRSASGLPFDQTVEIIAGSSTSSTVFAYCYGGDIYRSDNAGAAWTLVTSSLRAS